MTRDEFEKEALAALDSLYAYGLKLSRNQEDAADLVQETFAKALGHLETFREKSAIRPVLFRILHNSFVDSWRKKKQRPHLVALESPGEIAGSSSASWHDLGAKPFFDVKESLSEEVCRALDGLDESLRQTLWLREIEDFSYAEIAEILGIPVGTVRSRLARARLQMASNLNSLAGRQGYARTLPGKEGA